MARRSIIVALILFAPLGVISAAIYEMKTGKNRPTLYLLLVAIPGAFLAALKELKESGLLPPSRLGGEVDTNTASIRKWQQGLTGSDAVRQVTDIIIPLRIENTDPSKAIDILDVSIVPQEAGVQLQLPEMREIKVGSEKKWIYPFNSGAYSELLNDSKQKTIEPTKIKDFIKARNEDQAISLVSIRCGQDCRKVRTAGTNCSGSAKKPSCPCVVINLA